MQRSIIPSIASVRLFTHSDSTRSVCVAQQRTSTRSSGAKWLTDVNASYTLIRQLRLTVGSNTIFDVYPDRNIPANNNSGIFPYSQVSPFGFNGRFVYAKFRYEL